MTSAAFQPLEFLVSTPHQLQQQITAHSRSAHHLLAEKGDRKWSAADQAAFDLHMDEVDRLQASLQALPAAARTGNPLKAQYREGLDVYLRKGPGQMNDAQRAAVKNTMSTTTGSQGGFAVAPLVAQDLVSSLKGYGFMRAVAADMTTTNGADMGVPVSDGRTEVGELLGQNIVATSLDPSFATRLLPTYRFASKIFTVPLELLQDSQVDIIGFVMQRARDRIGRVQNPYFTTGTGTGEPTGLVTASSVGKTGATGQTLTVTYDDLVDLIDSVDDAHFGMPDTGGPAPGRMPGWMFSQTTRKIVRKVKDSNGRPIWLPSYTDGTTPGTPGQLLDYPVYINNDMPAPAANAKTIAFGNLSSYVIRDALEMKFYRFDDSTYTSKGQVGFLAWVRSGGNLLDTGAVRLYQHSAT